MVFPHQTAIINQMSSNSSIVPEFIADAENDIANVIEVQPAVVEVPKKKGKGVPKKSKKVEVQPAVEVPIEKIPESLSPVAPATPASEIVHTVYEDEEDANWEEDCRKLAGVLGGWEFLFKKYKEMEAKFAEKPAKVSLNEGGKKNYILDGKKVQSKPLFRGKNPNYDGELKGKKIYGRVSLKELVFIGVLDETTRYILADSGKILWNQKDGGSAIIEHLGETKKVYLFHDVE